MPSRKFAVPEPPISQEVPPLVVRARVPLLPTVAHVWSSGQLIENSVFGCAMPASAHVVPPLTDFSARPS
jgi:hypothetical protein